jgi:molybdate transport system substrate-binding protein
VTLASVLASATVASCGSSTSTSTTSSGAAPRVFAAASLTKVFPRIDPAAHYEFAGSDVLETQIRQGAPADVFASASPKQPQALYKDGLVQKPVNFATNTLVIIVPKSNPANIHTISDLSKPGTTIVIGDPTVPVGAYTRTVLKKLALTGLLTHVKSEDTDVKQVVQQVALGQADAGFAYVTDARSAAGQLLSIGIPVAGQPKVVYQIAVTSHGDQAAGQKFVDEVLSPRGQALLAAAGFGPSPPPQQQQQQQP